MSSAHDAETVRTPADRAKGILGPPGIPVERLLRLLRSITANLDAEDLATLMRIVSGEKWDGYPAHYDGTEEKKGGE